MTSAVERALIRSRAVSGLAHDLVTKAKGSGGFSGFDVGSGGDSFANQGASRRRYQLFRGWTHAAINALAMKAAQQPLIVGRLKNSGKTKPLSGSKIRMPGSIKSMTTGKEVDIDPDHELVDWLNNPNAMQQRAQFVYSFVANMCLTGWGFVASGKGKDEDKKDRFNFYSVPTTWVRPDHKDGPFSKFYIADPNQANAAEAKPLDRRQVGFAQFPNPSDPLGAMSIVQAQQQAIQIDDNIQTSQTVFFDNAVFPSAIVTVGKNPTGSSNEGFRPRLEPTQRRAIYAAIKKFCSGTSNYGNPVIIDGLIEKVERLSSTQNEIGWERSEKAVRSRILSGFGTHPFTLAEEMAGSYAQAAIVQSLLCDRVNFFIDALSNLMTRLCRFMLDQKDLLVYWEEAEARDPQLDATIMAAARARNDLSRNEFRAWFGYPPIEEDDGKQIDKQMIQTVISVASQVSSGTLSPEQGQAILESMGIPAELASKIAGEGPDDTADAVQEAARVVGKAIDVLTAPPLTIAEQLLAGV